MKEAFCQIYAPISTESALNGKVFSRAVRGQMLTQNALAEIILSQIAFEDDEKLFLNKFYAEVNKENLVKLTADENFFKIKQKFLSVVLNFKKGGPTTQY